jgi:U4/U6.U5 tri-snRNP-associated protein 2
VQFLSWILNNIHTNLLKSSKQSIIYESFQGEVIVHSQKAELTAEERARFEEHGLVAAIEDSKFDAERKISRSQVPFLMLTLDLPPTPLFQDEFESNIIPQVSLNSLLEKYNGAKIRVC